MKTLASRSSLIRLGRSTDSKSWMRVAAREEVQGIWQSDGARVTGVDISQEMIAQALSQEAESPLGISYQVASCTDLSRFQSRHFDLVSSFMAIMDMPDLDEALGEFHRIIRPGGRLAIMVRHPCHFTQGFSILKNRLGERVRVDGLRLLWRSAIL